MSNYLTENLRTVALVGHSASGKTSLVEAMLVRTGAIAEAGSVERGNTVCDNDPQEKRSVTRFVWPWRTSTPLCPT